MNSGRDNQRRDIKEFNISVAWGHVAVKTWGDVRDTHVLVFHGIMDNAGSFDNLIPYLPNSFYFICVDLPGHGRSSPLASKLPIQSIDYLIVYKLLVEYFKKEKYIFLCHSYGGQIALLFSRIYPNYVNKLIFLEVLPLYTIESKYAIRYLRKKMEMFSKVQKRLASEEQPRYTYEEALKHTSTARYEGEILLPHAVEPLLKRSLVPTDDGKYTFTTDPFMVTFTNPLHDARYLIETLKLEPISVPALLIYAKLVDGPRKRFAAVLDQLQRSKYVTVLYVDGGHDVHNNFPERVAGYINKFLLIEKAKL